MQEILIYFNESSDFRLPHVPPLIGIILRLISVVILYGLPCDSPVYIFLLIIIQSFFCKKHKILSRFVLVFLFIFLDPHDSASLTRIKDPIDKMVF